MYPRILILFRWSLLLKDIQKPEFLFLQPRISHTLFLIAKNKSLALFRLKVKRIIYLSIMTNRRMISRINNRKKMKMESTLGFQWLISILYKLFHWSSAWNSMHSSIKMKVKIWKMKFLKQLSWLGKFASRELKLSLLNIWNSTYRDILDSKQ